jgi:hypothetical protein
LTEWSKILPDKNINTLSPQKKSAADMITSYFNISAENLSVLVGLDERVLLNLNIRLKYRAVIKKEEERAN